jgi:hypothetical protein
MKTKKTNPNNQVVLRDSANGMTVKTRVKAGLKI